LNILTVSGEQSDGSTLAASTTGTADTMDIILRVVWIIVVEHMRDVLDVFANAPKLVQSCCVKAW
jgi:hypothetical protein